MTRITAETTCNGSELAEILGISKMAVSTMGRAGELAMSGNKYILCASVQAYLNKHVQRGQTLNADYEVERARKMRADADTAEVKAARAKKEVVDVTHVVEALTGIGAATKARLKRLESDLPPMLQGKSPADMRLMVRGEVDKILKALSDDSPKAYEQPDEE